MSDILEQLSLIDELQSARRRFSRKMKRGWLLTPHERERRFSAVYGDMLSAKKRRKDIAVEYGISKIKAMRMAASTSFWHK